MNNKFKTIGSILAVSAMMILAASCAKEELDTTKKVEYGPAKKINVSAQIMSARSEKAHMDGTNYNGINKVFWDEGDQITVNNGVLNIIDIDPDDPQVAGFTGSASPNTNLEPGRDVYRSIYPASIISSIPADDDPMVVSLPTVQKCNLTTDQIDNNYMAAYSSANASTDVTSVNLRYKNLCSVLKVVLTAQPGTTGVDAQVSRIRLTSPEGMSGDFEVTFNVIGNPVLTAVNGTPSNITELVFSTPVDISTQKTFYLMVPPIQNEALVMQIWNGDGTKVLQQETASATLNRSFVYTTAINTQFIDWVGPISVSNSQKVYFAHGNLRYHFVNNQWRFFDNQYDMLSKSLVENTLSTNESAQSGQPWFVNVPSNSYATNPGLFQLVYDRAEAIHQLNQWIDHFCFGTSGEPAFATEFRQPWHTFYGVVTGKAEPSNAYLFGPWSLANGSESLTGAYANGDWGVYHRSELNSSLSPVAGDWRTQTGDWRTPTQPEWYYCMTGAKRLDVIDNSKKCALARIEVSAGNYVNGLMLIPDKWHWYFMPENISFTPNDRGGFADNTYTLAQWSVLDQYGAVFLPAAGTRIHIVMDYGEAGFYQSASAATTVYPNGTGWNHRNQRGYSMFFFSATSTSATAGDHVLNANAIVPPNAVEGAFNKIDGHCVRLVRNTNEQ